MIDNLDNRIETILALCQDCNKLISHWGEPLQKRTDNNFWQFLKALNAEAGPGLQVGKHIRFSVADGYAHYIVKKVGKRTCKLVHIPYMDAYRSNAVSADGEVATDEIKPRIEFEEGLQRLFELKLQKRMTVAAE